MATKAKAPWHKKQMPVSKLASAPGGSGQGAMGPDKLPLVTSTLASSASVGCEPAAADN